MKRLIVIISVLAVTAAALLTASAASDLDAARKAYIEKYSALAISEMERSGVPASITLAQGIWESNAGRSYLAVNGNNHFGIKCGKAWKGKTIYRDDDAPNECFRSYPKVEDSYQNHSDFLRYYDRYKFLFDLEITDYKGWCYGLKQAGYATDPTYATRLIDIIEAYDLTRFDKGAVVKVESPDQLEKAVIMPVKYDEQFHFSLERTIYQKNGVACIYSVAGDTYDSIALIYDLFPREILRFNDLKEPVELLPGTIVYIQAKKNKAAKGLEKYIVGEDGESLREISQRFAVKMSSIVRRNKLKKDAPLVKEQELKLR
ncbi:MAG: glucosaminidase domain-containing protein [Bacteroidales bacterium]|nr:glucosaminidase domain-containing protein [Bacteroidales bacterium]